MVYGLSVSFNRARSTVRGFLMEIFFKNKKLAEIFNTQKELYKSYGKNIGDVIKRRMAVLAAAPTLAEVSHKPPERRHELQGKRIGEFAVDLDRRYRLVLKPEHNPLPRKEDEGLDLKKITAVTILGVEDYH
ncbi:MAG: killer suppression protein [Patescibacteria group bacterium]